MIELLFVLAVLGILGSVVTYLIVAEPPPEKTPRERCQWSIDHLSIESIPAGCLQFVEIPDWYVELQKSKSN